MKRINFKRAHKPSVVIANTPEVVIEREQAKPTSFISELMEKIDHINKLNDKVINNSIINDIHVASETVKFITNEVKPIVEELFKDEAPTEINEDVTTENEVKQEPEPEHKIITKQSLKVNQPVEEVKEEPKQELNNNLTETNTVLLEDPINANEECLLTISPIAKLPISHIVSANLIFANACDGVFYEIVESTDPCSFLLFVKNNTNNDLNVKVSYSVIFNETTC